MIILLSWSDGISRREPPGSRLWAIPGPCGWARWSSWPGPPPPGRTDRSWGWATRRRRRGRCYKNIAAALEKAGARLEDVVRTRMLRHRHQPVGSPSGARTARCSAPSVPRRRWCRCPRSSLRRCSSKSRRTRLSQDADAPRPITSSRGSRPTTRGSGRAILASCSRGSLAGRPSRAGVGLRDRQRTGGHRPGRRFRARGSDRRERRATSPRDAAPADHVSPGTGGRERPGRRQPSMWSPWRRRCTGCRTSVLRRRHGACCAGRRARRVGLSPARHRRAVGRSRDAALPRRRRRAVLASRAAARREPAANGSVPLHARSRRRRRSKSTMPMSLSTFGDFLRTQSATERYRRGCRRGPGARVRGSRRGRPGAAATPSATSSGRFSSGLGELWSQSCLRAIQSQTAAD